MKKYLLILLIFTVAFSGCKKEATDQNIRKTMIGRWYKVVSSTANECAKESWREFKEDGTYDDYDACQLILRESAGQWTVKHEEGTPYLLIKTKTFPINVYWTFSYLSSSRMIVNRVNSEDVESYWK